MTYSVAPAAAAPAIASATASACGRPPGCVQPRPTTRPWLTISAPTAGLGRLTGRARVARAAATASQRSSCLRLVNRLSPLRGLAGGFGPFFGQSFGFRLPLDPVDVHS